MKRTDSSVMKDDIIVTVIMAVYNRQNTVAKAVESILLQNFKDFEFIIVNDGSDDGTISILQRYEKQDDRIVLVNQSKRGLTYSLNYALKISKGEYILRQDADDVSMPQRIDRQLEYIRRNNLDIVSSYARLVNKKGAFLKVLKSPLTHQQIVCTLEKYNCILHPSLMFRKQAAYSIGFFDEYFELAQDYDFYLRGILNGLRFGVIPEVLVHMTFNPSGLTVKKRKRQLLYAIAAQAGYFAKKDTFRLIYIIYILRHILKIMIPDFIRSLRAWNRNRMC